MNNRPRSSLVSSRNHSAFEIALLYLLVGSLWILFSDQLAARIAPNQAVLTTISIYKGWGYVVVTALILYWLIHRDGSERGQAEEVLRKAYADLEFQIQSRTTALSQSNSFLETMLDYMPDQIYFKDVESRFIKNSRSQARALGLSDPALAVGKTDFDFFPHAQRSFTEEQEIIRTGKPLVDFEEQVVWPDGSETWVSTTKVPLRNQEGQVIGTFGISRDITYRKQAEESLRKAKDELEIIVAERTTELREANQQLRLELGERKQVEEKLSAAENRYRRFFENMHEAFVIQEIVMDETDKPIDLRFLDLNPAAEQFLGRTRNEIIGKTRSQLAGQPDPEGVAMASGVASTGTSFHMVHHSPGFGGWFESFTYSLGSGIVATLSMDITERKRAEENIQKLNEELEQRIVERTHRLEVANQELDNSKKEIQGILDSMTTLNAKVALDGTLLFVNKIAIQASGLPIDELMNTNFLEGQWWSFDPQVQTRVRDAFAKACSGHAVNYEEKIFVFGKILTISFNLTPMLGNNGRVEYVLAEAIDITQLKEFEESLWAKTTQLESANQELESFAYSVSHDLRSPLRSIDGFSQALLEDFGEQLPSEGQNYLKRVRASAQHMAELIDDLLNLSRVTRAPLNSASVDLGKLAKNITVELQQNNPERKARFRIAPNLRVQGDPRLLKVVLENLLNNSWKFTSKLERAEIEIGSKPENNETIYFVKDNGAGFDMAYADKLFGAFQRLHAMTEFPGTGIGLATVQRVIHRHGGRIWAEAELNQGATFFFSLPTSESEKARTLPKEQSSIIERAKEII